LSEFSPTGRSFTLDCILKITEVAQKLGLFFSTIKFDIKLDWARYILGDSFTNSSGHPKQKKHLCVVESFSTSKGASWKVK
jgi:hypothetical protein